MRNNYDKIVRKGKNSENLLTCRQVKKLKKKVLYGTLNVRATLQTDHLAIAFIKLSFRIDKSALKRPGKPLLATAKSKTIAATCGTTQTRSNASLPVTSPDVNKLVRIYMKLTNGNY